MLRVKEPALRGADRVPLGTAGVATLACVPFVVFVGVIVISFHDGEYGFASASFSLAMMASGLPWFFLLRRWLRTRAVVIAPPRG